MLAPVRLSKPAPLISLADAKLFLRVSHSDEDTNIVRAIEAATAELDGWDGDLGRCLVAQSWSQAFGGFADELRLPFPAISVESVSYYDPEGVLHSLSSAAWRSLKDDLGSYVWIQGGWPETAAYPDAVNVQFTAGYGAPSEVPADLRAAVLLMVGHLYANREAASPVPMKEIALGVTDKTEKYRLKTVGKRS